MQYLQVHLVLTAGKIVLLSEFGMALLGCLITYCNDKDVQRPRSLHGFARYCIPPGMWTNPNVRVDTFFFVFYRVMNLWIIVPLTLVFAAIEPATASLLASWFGQAASASNELPALFGLVIICLVATDFMEFFTHMLAHRWNWLWEFHQVHHSSEFLSPWGEKRSHIVDELWRTLPTVAFVAVCASIYSSATGLGSGEALLFGFPAIWLGYNVCHTLNFDVLHHSHIPFRYWRPLERLLVSPAQHHLHHDREGPSRNFGTLLSIWDRFFGSFAHSLPKGSFDLGLPVETQAKYRTIPEMMVRPFIGSAIVIHRSAKAALTRPRKLAERGRSTSVAEPALPAAPGLNA